MLDSTVSALIGRIYSDTAASDGLHDVVQEVVGRCGARGAMIAVANPLRAELAPPAFYGQLGQVDDIHLFESGLYLRDPTLAFLTANPTARLFDTSVHMTPADHAADPFIAWVSDVGGIAHWTTGYAERDAGNGFVMSVHTRDPQTEAARNLFRMFFEHFEIAQMLCARAPDLALDTGATIILDDGGRVVAMTEGAERLLARGDGVSLYDRRLVPSAQSAVRALDMLIGSAVSAIRTGGAGGAMAMERPSGRSPLAVSVDPLPEQAGLGRFRSGAIVRLVDPDDGPAAGAVDRWRAIWGLTPAEALLAEAMIASDCDLRGAADRLGRSYATVRTQLSRILAKTRTGGQPELMRLLARVSG